MEDQFLGYIKYKGELVHDGFMDARRSAEALKGIDEVFRYFIYQVSPDLQKFDFEIPVRIRKGSWEALIPNSVSEWLLTAGGAGLTAYATSALSKAAENDIGDKGFKDVFKQVFKSIKWTIKIAKHLKSLAIKQIADARFKTEQGEMLIGIPGEDGILYVPKRYLDLYNNCPEELFTKLVKNVEPGRELEIGLNENEPLDKDDTERSVSITYKNKSVFIKDEEDDEILFPELKHNDYVELEGHVSRGNENSNTIGFEYLRHILTCYPATGNIKEYKNLLFTNCIMKGYVDRLGSNGDYLEKKPKIRFVDLLEVGTSSNQSLLFR